MKSLITYIKEAASKTLTYITRKSPHVGDREMKKVFNSQIHKISYDDLTRLINSHMRYAYRLEYGWNMSHMKMYAKVPKVDYAASIYAGRIDNSDHNFTMKFCANDLVDRSIPMFVLLFINDGEIMIDIHVSDDEHRRFETHDGDTIKYVQGEKIDSSLQSSSYGIVKQKLNIYTLTHTDFHGTPQLDEFDLFLIPIILDQPIEENYGFIFEMDKNMMSDVIYNKAYLYKAKRHLSPLAYEWMKVICDAVDEIHTHIFIECQGDTTPSDYVDVWDEMLAHTKKYGEDDLYKLITLLRFMSQQKKYREIMEDN